MRLLLCALTVALNRLTLSERKHRYVLLDVINKGSHGCPASAVVALIGA